MAARSSSKRHDVAIADARLLAEHHIAGVRYTRTGRRISHVLHPMLGWLTIHDYYMLQKLHDAEPMLLEAAKAGWAFNVAIYSFMPEVSILGTGLALPIGPAMLGAVIAQLHGAILAQDGRTILWALAKLAMPWGAVLQMMESLQGTIETYEVVTQSISDFWGGIFDAFGKIGEGIRWKSPFDDPSRFRT